MGGAVQLATRGPLTWFSALQAWRAIADETVQQGSALPALQAVYAASNRQISISQRTLQRLGLKLVACTNLNVRCASSDS